MTAAHDYVSSSEAWMAWTLEPLVVAGLLLSALLYAAGVARLWTPGRGRGITVTRVVAFYAGLLAIGIALVSPVDALARTLFSAHMVQHLVLMVVAAPLLVYASPLKVTPLALPATVRSSLRKMERSRSMGALRRVLGNGIVASSLYAAVLWAWHLPALYEAALQSETLHALEHVTFVLTSVLVWSLVITTSNRRVLTPRPHRSQNEHSATSRRGRNVAYPVSLAVVFVTGLHSAALGAVLTFASEPLYAIHARGALLWEVSPLSDQQLAGAIMWVPGGAIYLTTMSVLFVRWLKAMERETKGAQRAAVAGARES